MYDRNIFGLDHPRKSQEIFDCVRKPSIQSLENFEIILKHLCGLQTIFGESLDSGWESSKNHRKRRFSLFNITFI